MKLESNLTVSIHWLPKHRGRPTTHAHGARNKRPCAGRTLINLSSLNSPPSPLLTIFRLPRTSHLSNPPRPQIPEAAGLPPPPQHCDTSPHISKEQLTRSGASAKPASPRINSPFSNGGGELPGLIKAQYHDRPVKAAKSPRDPGKPPTTKRTSRVSVMKINRTEHR